MTAPTFTWSIQTQATGTETARVRTAQFGDGYKQVAQDGLNPVTGSWPITVGGASTDVRAARDFLRARAGQSFYWTPPGDVQGLWRCVQWTIKPDGGIAFTLTATFEQAFGA